MEKQKFLGNCELCNRWKYRSSHHLIPKTCHKNKWFKKNFTLEELNQGIMLCCDCHKYIHAEYTEKDLGRDFNMIETLREDGKIAKFIKFVRKKK